jgi:hypothetical protein
MAELKLSATESWNGNIKMGGAEDGEHSSWLPPEVEVPEGEGGISTTFSITF